MANTILAKDIRGLFKAIRRCDVVAVKGMLRAQPALVRARSLPPPKKDDGQSPLQVAFKTGQFDLADFFIRLGADVNFIEQSKLNAWRTPVLHDAIRAAAFNTRFGVSSPRQDFLRALRSLKLMLKSGADPNAVDSYGNSCLGRAYLDARIRTTGRIDDPVDPAQLADLAAIFAALLSAGADVRRPTQHSPSLLDEIRGTRWEPIVVRACRQVGVKLPVTSNGKPARRR